VTAPVTQPQRRTYFNNPLITETLAHLPAAVEHPTTAAFKAYLVDHLHQSSRNTRQRFAEYIAERYAKDGVMNRILARAIARFGPARAGREILCFELLRSAPLFQDASSLWLAEQPLAGAPRARLLEFLEPRLHGRSVDTVGKALVQAWRELGKLQSPKLAVYVPVWSAPPVEAFLYVLAALFPERAMVRVDVLAGLPILRALLWPRTCLEPLLQEALRLGHVSKISELDQYHQFTLADSGEARLESLLEVSPVAAGKATKRAKGRGR
jgi:hypothetical protein